MAHASTSSPRRRWIRLRYSLGMALVAFTCCNLLCVYLNARFSAAKRQFDFLAQLERAGGTWWLEYEPTLSSTESAPDGHTWRMLEYRGGVTKLLGDDFSFRVTGLILRESDLLQDVLAELHSCAELRFLAVGDVDQLSDTQWQAILGCDKLESLLIEGPIPPERIADIATFPRLTHLSIRWSPVDDRVVVPLSRLTSLKCLDVTETQISNLGVCQLQEKLPQCEVWFGSIVLHSGR